MLLLKAPVELQLAPNWSSKIQIGVKWWSLGGAEGAERATTKPQMRAVGWDTCQPSIQTNKYQWCLFKIENQDSSTCNRVAEGFSHSHYCSQHLMITGGTATGNQLGTQFSESSAWWFTLTYIQFEGSCTKHCTALRSQRVFWHFVLQFQIIISRRVC